jgi:hypothetical protein
LRIGNVAGADALLLNVIAGDRQAPLEIDIFPNEEGPIRSYIGPQSLSGVLKALSNSIKPLPPVVNLAAPNPISMNSLADAARVRWKAKPVSDDKNQVVTLDCSMLEEFYQFQSFESGPGEIIKQWKSVT